jgi:hypothetical protein
MTKKVRDEAIERVGRALYGKHWIGPLQTREWNIGKDSDQLRSGRALFLPPSGKEASRIAAACFRYHASDLQTGQVYCWLHEQGIKMDEFNSDVFEAWFRSAFPSAPKSSTEARQRAVRAELQASGRPGRGGVNLTKFCDNVRKRCGLRFNQKTIERDVRAILRAT